MNLTPEVRRRLDWLILLLLPILCYSTSLGNEWIWDDDDYVTENPLLKDAGGLADIWFAPSKTPQYYPLVHTSFWIEHQIWGLSPAGYHFINILLHAIAALLLWRLLRLLEMPGAWLGAAIFAVHPVMVESVAWVTERKNVLSGVFYLAAAYAYMRYAKELRSKYLAFTVVFFACALLSKTVTASLPLALLLVCWWKKIPLSRNRVLPLLFLFVLGGAMGFFITAADEVSKVRAIGSEWDWTFLERCLIAGRAAWFYLWKLIAPIQLIFIYPRWDIDAGAWWQYLYPLSALLLLGILWWRSPQWGRGPLVALLIFGGTLVPALGFLNVYPHLFSFVADHFQYHASIAMLSLFAALSYRLPLGMNKDDQRKFAEGPLSQPWSPRAILLFGSVLLILGSLTLRQTWIYENETVLWEDNLERNPEAWIAHNNLGSLAFEERNFDKAKFHFEECLKLKQNYSRALNNLGLIYAQQGDLKTAESNFLKAIEAEPDYVNARIRLAEIYMGQGRPKEATEQARLAVVSGERLGMSAPELANLHTLYGDTLARLGSFDESIAQLRIALNLQPGKFQTRSLLGRSMASSGATKEALPILQEVVQQTNHLGTAMTLAWIRCSHKQALYRDGKEAHRLAQMVHKGLGSSQSLDLLAASFAELRQFGKARTHAQRALQMAEQQKQSAHAEEIASRLAGYQQQKPFRSETGLPGLR